MASKPLQIYTLTSVKERGQNFAFYAISCDQDILEGTIINSSKGECKLAAKIKADNYYVLNKCTLNSDQGESGVNYLRLYEDSSKVFQTGKSFDVDDDVVNQFFNPPLLTVPEALVLPKKRKLSLEGKIAEVFPMRTGKHWKRTDFFIEDTATKTKIQCKLWGDLAETIKVDHAGSSVSLTNVEIDVFNNKKHLKSIDLSTIHVAAPSSLDAQEYQVLGVDMNDGILTLITDTGVELVACMDVFENAGVTVNEFIERSPLKASLHILNGTVKKMEILS